MKTLSKLLSCEASFIAGKDLSVYNKDSSEAPRRAIQQTALFAKGDSSLAERVSALFDNYRGLKARCMEDPKKNLFY